MKTERNHFVDAYQWAYGSTKKAALEVYKTADASYIKAIIDGYDRQCHLSYND